MEFTIRRCSIDLKHNQVMRGGKAVYPSAREMQLLLYFVKSTGQVVARTYLLRVVWGYDVGTFRLTVDVHVANLRQKLEKDPKNPELMLSVSGTGYRFAGTDV